jgi:hypothetical protein
MLEVIAAMQVVTRIAVFVTNLKIPEREITISIENESNHTLTNVSMYFNGTSIIPVSPNIAPSKDPSNA